MLAPPRAFAACDVNRRMLFADGTAPTSNGWTAGSSSCVGSSSRSRHGFSREMRSAAWSAGSSRVTSSATCTARSATARSRSGSCVASEHRAARLLLGDDPRRRAGPASRGRAAARARRARAASAAARSRRRAAAGGADPTRARPAASAAWSVEPELLEQPGDDLLRAVHAVPAGRQVEVLGDRQRREVRVVVEHAGHLRAERDVALVDGRAEHLQRPARRLEQPDHGPQHRRLAGAVGADEGDDPAGRQRERHGCAHGRPAVADEQVLGADDGLRHVRQGIAQVPSRRA